MAAERAAWKASQPQIDVHRLVFIDETGASTKMARLYGRSPYGQRCVDVRRFLRFVLPAGDQCIHDQCLGGCGEQYFTLSPGLCGQLHEF